MFFKMSYTNVSYFTNKLRNKNAHVRLIKQSKQRDQNRFNFKLSTMNVLNNVFIAWKW